LLDSHGTPPPITRISHCLLWGVNVLSSRSLPPLLFISTSLASPSEGGNSWLVRDSWQPTLELTESETPPARKDVELIGRRLKEAGADYKVRYAKEKK
jgi:hypothetical protein